MIKFSVSPSTTHTTPSYSKFQADIDDNSENMYGLSNSNEGRTNTDAMVEPNSTLLNTVTLSNNNNLSNSQTRLSFKKKKEISKWGGCFD